MFTRHPRFARLAAGIGRAAFIVGVCAGVMVILVCVALMVAAGLYQR